MKSGYFSDEGNHRDKLVFASKIDVEDIDDDQEENLDKDLEDNFDEDSEDDPDIDLEYQYDDELEGNDGEEDDELEVDNVELTSNTSVPWLHNEVSLATSGDWYVTPLAKDRPLASCFSNSYYLKNCKGKKKWSGGWPPKLELPPDQRRDTACPFTFKNETRKRIQRWPDIIGIGIPKCGTGRL